MLQRRPLLVVLGPLWCLLLLWLAESRVYIAAGKCGRRCVRVLWGVLVLLTLKLVRLLVLLLLLLQLVDDGLRIDGL